MLRKGGNTVSDAGLNYYLLINAATSATLQTKVLADEGHYQLTFSQVPKGEYFLLGGTDMDNDGFICEGGELCGGYPSVEQLLPIKISEDVADLKFSANFSQSLQIVTGASLKNNSKLLAKMSKTNGVARPKSQKQTGYKRIDGQVVSD
jgi:serine protease